MRAGLLWPLRGQSSPARPTLTKSFGVRRQLFLRRRRSDSPHRDPLSTSPISHGFSHRSDSAECCGAPAFVGFGNAKTNCRSTPASVRTAAGFCEATPIGQCIRLGKTVFCCMPRVPEGTCAEPGLVPRSLAQTATCRPRPHSGAPMNTSRVSLSSRCQSIFGRAKNARHHNQRYRICVSS